MRPRTRPVLGPVVLALLVAGSGAEAQVGDTRPATVIGRVTDVETGDPVVGAFVTVVRDDDGTRIAGTLAGDDGRFVLRTPPGTFRLRVQRIGIDGSLSEAFEVRPGQLLVRDLPVGAEVISLEGVSVSGVARCDLSGDDRGETMAVWDEARKALAVAAWSDELGLYTYTTELWQRMYDPSARRVVSESTTTRTGAGRTAFRSVPADSLARYGYVVGNDDERLYYAPDASVLLSDSFLRTHCFRTVRDGGRLGLAFEPVPDRVLPDIRGTIWLDADGLLDRLDFEYTRLQGVAARSRTLGSLFRAVRLGGTVDFEGLETGGWIVRRWNIRMPSVGVEVDAGGEVRRRFLDGIVEVGGEVRSATQERETLAFDGQYGAIRGTVRDSTGGSGLADALVYLDGTSHSTFTGPDGGYLLERLRPAHWELVVEHPLRTELGVPAPRVEVESEPGAIQVAPEVSFPARSEVLDARCLNHAAIELEGDFARRGELAVVGGALLDRRGEPVEGGRVQVRWRGPDTEGDAPELWRGIEVRSDAGGGWFVCGVPNDVRIDVRTLDTDGEAWQAPVVVGAAEPGARLWVTLERRGGG